MLRTLLALATLVMLFVAFMNMGTPLGRAASGMAIIGIGVEMWMRKRVRPVA